MFFTNLKYIKGQTNYLSRLERILYIFKKIVLFLCHFENDTSCRNELLHCVLALLEWLIKLLHYGNNNHLNALAQ